MRYKLLGKSGLRVSELCLGTMTFGDDWGWGADRPTSQKIFEGFAEAGGRGQPPRLLQARGGGLLAHGAPSAGEGDHSP